MSPLRRTPHEILQEIFLACLPTEHNALIDPGEDAHAAWLHLWPLAKRRAVHVNALELAPHPKTPSSWSSTTRPENIAQKLEQVVETWLDRSAACPLSISFSGTEDSDFDPVDQLMTISQRIRNLRLGGDIGGALPVLLLAGGLPCLESISIQLASYLYQPFASWEPMTVQRTQSAPNFTQGAQTDALTLPLPWSQLTDLSLQCFIFVDPNGTQGSLNLNDAQECLVLPKLRYLGVGSYGLGLHQSLRAVEDSAHTLTLELMDRCHLPNDGIINLLTLLPSISRIQTPDFDLDETTRHLLFLEESLLKFIQARMSTIHPLQRVEARFTRAKDVELVQELQTFIS
ncbi:hypothetical protein DFH09DRAFT_1434103 [Mycena vulgaris]|nr:hypothetical protein DFH09DRAFT_1434103 [Mycena vulgaris]